MSGYDYDGPVDDGLPDPRDAHARLRAFVETWGDGEVEVATQDPPPVVSRTDVPCPRCGAAVGAECRREDFPAAVVLGGHASRWALAATVNHLLPPGTRRPLHTRDVAALLGLGVPDCEWRVEGMPFRTDGGLPRTEASSPISERLFDAGDRSRGEARELAESLIPSRGGRLVRRFTATSPWRAPDRDGYAAAMTENTAAQPAEPTTEVAVEIPAKTVETVEVAESPETAGAAEPDAATKAMDVEDKEHPAP